MIATLTMNPTIDVAYEVDRMRHTHKMRTTGEHYCPGGGGINVARVIARLGGSARCFYLSGGATGPAFDGLVDLHQLVRTRVAIAGNTRIAMNVLDEESGREYRLTPPGPAVSEAEWREMLDRLAGTKCDWLVASGSLPPGVPPDFYARVAGIARDLGARMVLDTSGAALKEGLAGGGVFFAKPSQGELEALVGRKLESVDAIGEAASAIVAAGQARLAAVTMGHRGALLAQASGTSFLPAVPIEAASAVGAGDSFVAGMVHALSTGHEPDSAFRFAMAAGAAAVLKAGTSLAHPEDIARLLPLVGD